MVSFTSAGTSPPGKYSATASRYLVNALTTLASDSFDCYPALTSVTASSRSRLAFSSPR